jgi:coenzyme F420-0:L-glutamate ligase
MTSAIPKFEVYGVPDVPEIVPGDDIAALLVDCSKKSGIGLLEKDVVVVASKAISFAQNRIVDLTTVQPTKEAIELHQKVPRKSAAICQLILDQTDSNVLVSQERGHILGILPNGMQLTSAGVDRIDDRTAILLPKDPDIAARDVSMSIFDKLGIRVGVLISDSQGRADRQGAGAVAIGAFGVPALRFSSENRAPETYCDFLANAASILLGQRGTGYPFVIIRGLNYSWSEHPNVNDILILP